MIIAIDGPSAVGKTTWCRQHSAHALVEEAPANIAAPDLYAEPLDVAGFWVKYNIARWQDALRVERELGVALCDGEPFNLRFSWCAWKVGELDRTLFDIELAMYRLAIRQQEIGFADITLWMDAPLEVLRRRAAADTKRRRKRHEIYLRMIPWMRVWAEAKGAVLPGSLRQWTDTILIEDFRDDPISPRRYDETVVDALMENLEGAPMDRLAREAKAQ